MTDPTETAWTLDHDLVVLNQTEARPGETDTDGNRWLDYRTTGKVIAVCTCGYTSGLVDPTTLADRATLLGAHPSAMSALGHAAKPSEADRNRRSEL
jgi:hypothetical protein